MAEYHLTQEKKAELEQELADRRGPRRADILVKLEAARELGDLKENAEYHAMRDMQGKNESRLREIEEILKHVVVVEKPTDGVVGLASQVTVTRGDSGAQSMFTIVGPQESDIISGKIADNSPLGTALMAKRVGDVAVVETPKGAVEYTIKAVE